MSDGGSVNDAIMQIRRGRALGLAPTEHLRLLLEILVEHSGASAAGLFVWTGVGTNSEIELLAAVGQVQVLDTPKARQVVDTAPQFSDAAQGGLEANAGAIWARRLGYPGSPEAAVCLWGLPTSAVRAQGLEHVLEEIALVYCLSTTTPPESASAEALHQTLSALADGEGLDAVMQPLLRRVADQFPGHGVALGQWVGDGFRLVAFIGVPRVPAEQALERMGPQIAETTTEERRAMVSLEELSLDSDSFDRLFVRTLNDLDGQPLAVCCLFLPPGQALAFEENSLFWLARLIMQNFVRWSDLEEQEQRIRAIFDHSTHPLALVDPTGHFLEVNQAFSALMGYEQNEMLGRSVLDITMDVDQPAFLGRLGAIGQGPVRVTGRRFRRKTGGAVFAELRAAPVLGEAGEVRHIIAELVEMTEHYRMAEELAARERDLLRVQRVARMGMWTLDVETGRLSYNEELLDLLGAAIGIQMKHLDQLDAHVHPKDRKRVAQAVESTLRGDEPFDIEYRLIPPDSNRPVWVHSYGDSDVSPEGRHRIFGAVQDISARRMQEEALRNSEERFRSLFESAAHGILMTSPEGQFVQVNRAFCEWLGYGREELLRLGFRDISHPDERKSDLKAFSALRDGTQKKVFLEKRYLRADGKAVWGSLAAAGVYNPDGTLRYIVTHIMDTDARHRAEELLAAEKERMQVTLKSIGDAVITTDARGRIEFMNPVAESLTGWRGDEVAGQPLEHVMHIFNEDTRLTVPNPVDRVLKEGKVVGLANHTVLVDRHGNEIAIEDSAAPIRDRNGEIVGVVMVFHDVSEAREMSLQMNWQATHDALTGLVNRRESEHRIGEAIRRAHKEDVQHCFLYLDLDQFKVVNDTCGHLAGDELLRQLSHILHEQVREIDTLARLGGDEFGLLLEYCSLSKGLEIAEQLRDSVREFRFVWEKAIFEVGVSIGVVVIDNFTEHASQVMRWADMACYAAKDLGRNRVHLYEPEDQEVTKRHSEMRWVARISQALAENRFELHVQEIRHSSAPARGLGRYEVLLRMINEERDGLIAPGQFLPAAERFGLMPNLDRWVVDHCLRSLSTRPAQIDLLFINLSGATLSDDRFSDFIVERMREESVDPSKICFEITETAAIANLVKASRLIHDLKALGCQFALDDFGSGLSSFGYLKNLPVDFIKIDGHFVVDVAEDSVDRIMVQSIHRIGHEMGIQTIAEFVESERIGAIIADIGIDYVQGFHIAKPLPLTAALDGASQAGWSA